MLEDIYYFVMQTYKGQVFAHGPYKTRAAAERRRDKVQGGEIVVYQTFTPDPQQAIRDFKLEGL